MAVGLKESLGERAPSSISSHCDTCTGGDGGAQQIPRTMLSFFRFPALFEPICGPREL